MKSNRVLPSILARSGHIPPEIVDISKIVDFQRDRTDFWNIFWLLMKAIYPKRVELYRGFTHVLPVITLDRQVTREDLESFLSVVHHLTLVNASIRVSSDDLYFFHAF